MHPHARVQSEGSSNCSSSLNEGEAEVSTDDYPVKGTFPRQTTMPCFAFDTQEENSVLQHEEKSRKGKECNRVDGVGAGARLINIFDDGLKGGERGA